MRNLIIVAFVLTIAPCLVGQDATPTNTSEVRFEVASVKPNNSDHRSSSTRNLPGGQYEAVNLSLSSLIQSAYGLQPFQVSGGPAWISSERFDLIAKTTEGKRESDGRLTATDLQHALQAVLRDRFGLVAHVETREIPIYALVMARQDKRLGPQLKTFVDCAVTANCGSGQASGGRGGGDTVTVGPGLTYTSTMANSGSTMAAFAKSLSRSLDRIVLDRTGLDGKFDIRLSWNQNDSPNVFTAIQEQLGLKLESGKGPVEMLVIDHVEPPTPD